MDGHHGEDPMAWLALGAGEWHGEEHMPPAPWAPEGLVSRGETRAHLALGGRLLVSEYRQASGGATVAETLSILRWDAKAEAYVMDVYHANDHEGPLRFTGARDDDGRLVLEGPGPGGLALRHLTMHGGDEMRVESHLGDGEGGWVAVFEAVYTRVTPPA
jgi:hypothetical protein